MTNEELAIRIQKKIDVAENMLQLWQQNTGMIAQMAHRYRHMADEEELRQEGYIALCDAVDHYDPDRGASFSTVLFQYLRLHLVRYCQNSGIVRLPVHTVEKVRKYQKLVSAFRQQVGRKPTDSELCYYLQISEKELRTIQHAEQMKQIGSRRVRHFAFSEEHRISSACARFFRRRTKRRFTMETACRTSTGHGRAARRESRSICISAAQLHEKSLFTGWLFFCKMGMRK